MKTETFSGSCEGRITIMNAAEQMDLVMIRYFMFPKKKRTMAELSPEEKNEISHRGAALSKLQEKLPKLLAILGSDV